MIFSLLLHLRGPLRLALIFALYFFSNLQLDGSVRKMLKGGKDFDDALIAVVIRNLKLIKVSYELNASLS